MDKKTAQNIISQVNRDYNAVSKNFSRARDKEWPEMVSLINKYFNENNLVLDLGCGNGRFYLSATKQGLSYTGIDNSKELIKIARERHPEGDFHLGDALKLPFKDDSFDGIFSIAVLHHIPSKEMRLRFLNEAFRVLKKDCFLIITVWSIWNNKKLRKEIFREALLKIIKPSKMDFQDLMINWYGAEKCYIHAFTLNELKKLALRSDFSIQESGKINLKNKKSLSNYYLVLKKES